MGHWLLKELVIDQYQNKMRIFFLLFFITLGCVTPVYSSGNDQVIEQSMGRLIFLHDKLIRYDDGSDNPFGTTEVFLLFKNEYEEKIKHLPLYKRIDFFWASLWHLDFDGHDMFEFLEIVEMDCGEQFIAKLKKYIEKEKIMNRHKSLLAFSEKTYLGLLGIRDTKK